MKITVGVPTHNSEFRIAECLDCLLAQNHPDFEIIVSENGSTDRTAEICRAYAAWDNRITVFHHDPTICMRDNFRFVLHKAQAPLFHWRADDDLSDINFLSTLHDLLEREPHKKLAGGAVKIIHTATGKTKNPCKFPEETYEGDPARRLLEFFVSKKNFHACDWFYGLWHREHLLQVVDRLWRTYDSKTLWGTDALTVLATVAKNSFACSRETAYIKRLIKGQRSPAKPTEKKKRLATRFRLYGACLQAFRQEINHTHLSAEEKGSLARIAVPFSRRTLNINLEKDLRWRWHSALARWNRPRGVPAANIGCGKRIADISAVLIVKDEEAVLGNCLTSLGRFDEIIVYLNNTTDRSREIAKRFSNVKVVEGPFLGFGPTRNAAATHASNDWIYIIDADEANSAELTDSIAGWATDTRRRRGVVCMTYRFMGRRMKGGMFRPISLMRLYNRKDDCWENAVHEGLKAANAERVYLPGFLHHQDINIHLDNFEQKLHFYSSLHTLDGVKPRPKGIAIIGATMTFLVTYLVRYGVIDGWPGIVTSYWNAKRHYIKYCAK